MPNELAATPLDRKALGDRLREAREYLGLTQDDVAKKLGIPRSAISNVEAGTRKVEAMEFAQLARLYQRDLSWFTGGRPAKKVPQVVAHVARTAEALSTKDRAELARFADFLKSRARGKAHSDE
jgi:transcriptional regulator with XRE-family HTH domain